MNFEGKGGNRDVIVSITVRADKFSQVHPGIYRMGDDPVVDEEVFLRTKPISVVIQASQFDSHSKRMVPIPVEERDPVPYLYNEPITGNVVHHRQNPETGTFVSSIFKTARSAEIFKGKWGRCIAVCAVKSDIIKNTKGYYTLNPNNLRCVSWDIRKGTYMKQLDLTKEAKRYVKQSLVDKVLSTAEACEEGMADKPKSDQLGD